MDFRNSLPIGSLSAFLPFQSEIGVRQTHRRIGW